MPRALTPVGAAAMWVPQPEAGRGGLARKGNEGVGQEVRPGLVPYSPFFYFYFIFSFPISILSLILNFQTYI
jgi:hypothetical protein